jgi:hypothetical protein
MSPVVVLSAVEFDDQSDLETNEVRKVGSDRKLPAELATVDLAIAQSRPETAFGVRLVATELARERQAIREFDRHALQAGLCAGAGKVENLVKMDRNDEPLSRLRERARASA